MINFSALFRIKTVFITLVIPITVSAQDAHYWNKQHGPTSNFLGGAVTGGVRDNSAIFYNPGATAFTTDFTLSIQSDAVSYMNLFIRNGAGEDLSMQQSSLESSPQMFAVSYGVKKRPTWRTSFGFLTTDFSHIRLRTRNEKLVDIYPGNNGKEIYAGSWNYRNRMREDWYGAAITHKLGENLGIGLSSFLTFRTYEYVETKDQNIYIPDGTGDFQPSRYVYSSDIMDGSAAGLLFKLGVAWEINDFKLGLSVTTPRAQLNFLASYFLSSSQYSQIGTGDSNLSVPNYTLQYNKAKSTFKSPWIIDIGVMKNFFNTDLYVRVAYYSKVDLYQMVEPTVLSEISQLLGKADPGAGKVIMANKEIWNFGFGWNKQYTEKFGMMAGIRTDFNYLDQELLDNTQGVLPAISYWNIYHLSGGTTVTLLKHKFTIGLTYSHGFEKNGNQFFNLDPPNYDELFKQPETGAQAYYDQINLLIGYVYDF